MPPTPPSLPSAGGGQNPTKAIIRIIYNETGKTEQLQCYFNPTEYSVSRNVTWNPTPQPGTDVPKFTFGGASQSTLSLNLLFDTSMEKSGDKDVRTKYTNKLVKATYKQKPSEDKSEPPHVLFIWGKTWNFEAVITSVATQFTLFQPDGTPIRASVTVGLTQIVDHKLFPRQNPTSGAISGDIHVVSEGDRLDLLAARFYKKPTAWKHIAEYNGIDNPRQLRPGSHLIIPPLP